MHGISTSRIFFLYENNKSMSPAIREQISKELGAEITAYYATEIDKYAIQTTQNNYPDTVQLGDAFQVRDNNWRLGEEL